MRIGIFFSDGVIANITLNNLIPQMIEIGMEPVLFKSHGPKVAHSKIPELNEISYLESGLLKDIVEPTMELLPDTKNKNLTTKQLVKKYNIDFQYVENVNDPDFINFITSEAGIHAGISIRFYPIFKKEIIDSLNKNGFLWNLHTGLLPKYKGVFIPYHCIENDEDFYGWTLHEVDYTIDTGPIIGTDKLPLDKTKPVLDTYLGMVNRGVAMTMGALLCYQKRRTINSIHQVMEKESYFTYPTQNEMKKWNRDGIAFSNNIIETYLHLYTEKGSYQEECLHKALIEKTAITFEESKDTVYSKVA